MTEAGTDAALELEESATTAPPEGAAEESVTVPVTVPPLATELPDRVRLLACGRAATAIVAVFEFSVPAVRNIGTVLPGDTPAGICAFTWYNPT